MHAKPVANVYIQFRFLLNIRTFKTRLQESNTTSVLYESKILNIETFGPVVLRSTSVIRPFYAFLMRSMSGISPVYPFRVRWLSVIRPFHPFLVRSCPVVVRYISGLSVPRPVLVRW